MRKTIGLLTLLAIMGTSWLTARAEDKPKHTIKEVMKLALKGPLNKKVAEGKASDDEKKQLVELYESLAANKPPKGDEADWKKRTEALLDAAKKADGMALGKASNCKACHDAHQMKK